MFPSTFTIVVRLAVSLCVLACITLGCCSCSIVSGLTTGPLPQHQGTLNVDGLQYPVEILRDRWGVPQIYGQNAHDVYFAQGYTHAQDRWWQMELYRHVGRGALSEMLGLQTLGDDIYLRTLHLYATAQEEVEQAEPVTRAMLEAFADGVNAYILSRDTSHLAMEYAALKITGVDVAITPWTPADSLVFGKIIQLQQGVPVVDESLYESILAKVGPERIKYWAPPLPYGIKPTILQRDDLPHLKARASSGIVQALLQPPLGSNSWVIDGAHSTTGRPIFENDPHLGVSMPSLYYEIGLHSAGAGEEQPFDVAGVAFSPSPSVAIGHNAYCAWGITIGKGVDGWDTYHIKVNPARPLEQYEWNGEWVDFTVRDESFTIAGRPDPFVVQVRETVHGPIINDTYVEGTNGPSMELSTEPLALHWVGLEPCGLGSALCRLAKVQNWNGFRKALEYWDAPACNFSYADNQGNIGYQLAAKIPLRAKDHDGMTPAPGWTDAYLWKGFLPYSYNPHTINPERGILIHTNQAVAQPDYFDWLAAQFPEVNTEFQLTAYYGYRAERLHQLLDDGGPFSLDDCSNIQADIKLTREDEMMPYLQSLSIDDAGVRSVRDWLLAWDRAFTEDSGQATLYSLFTAHLLEDIFADEAPTPLPSDGPMMAVGLLLPEPNNAWWDDMATTDVVEDRDTILVKALREANEEAVRRFGALHNGWRWGKWHSVEFVNMPLGLSGIGIMEMLVNRGPYSLPGTVETVNVAEWVDDGTTFAVKWAPCMRMLLDVGAWDNSRISVTPGQSGHPASANYNDQVELWRTGGYRTMAFSREAVEKAAKKRLTLMP